MGVYSGVYEYTQQIQEQIQVYRVYQVFGHLLSCRQDPCSIIRVFQLRKCVFLIIGILGCGSKLDGVGPVDNRPSTD